MEQETLPMDRLAKIYLKIRGVIQEKTKVFEAEIETLNEQKKAVSFAMKDQMQAAGVTSMKTQYGTAMLSTKTRFWASDWDEMNEFCMQQGSIAFLEKRIAQTVMAKFLEENPGQVPPGLNSESEYVVSVRKST